MTEQMYHAWQQRKASALKRPTLSCGCRNDGRSTYVRGCCDRIVCRMHQHEEHTHSDEAEPEPALGTPTAGRWAADLLAAHDGRLCPTGDGCLCSCVGCTGCCGYHGPDRALKVRQRLNPPKPLLGLYAKSPIKDTPKPPRRSLWSWIWTRR